MTKAEQALIWYEEQCRSLARGKGLTDKREWKDGGFIEAIVVSLSNDGGRRARDAIAARNNEEEGD